jgi:hypothetical protein
VNAVLLFVVDVEIVSAAEAELARTSKPGNSKVAAILIFELCEVFMANYFPVFWFSMASFFGTVSSFDLRAQID